MRSMRQSFPGGTGVRTLVGALLFVSALVVAPVSAGIQGQKPDDDTPVYTAYRGVHIGDSMADARKALGDAVDKSDTQDVFVFNETELATIYYDTDKKVKVISVDFMSGSRNPPTPQQVVGSTIEAKPDGSVYKVVDYPKAGYKVIYNRTAGQAPMVSVTMQKLQ